MSIRLKRVEWEKDPYSDGSIAWVLGAWYKTILLSNGRWAALRGHNAVSAAHATEDAAKAACEQHALERIREAVEVETNSPEIPDGWRDISTAPRDGAWALVYMDGAVDCMYVKQGQQPQNWTEPRSPNVHPSLVTHWMPLPKPPKEGEK